MSSLILEWVIPWIMFQMSEWIFSQRFKNFVLIFSYILFNFQSVYPEKMTKYFYPAYRHKSFKLQIIF